MTIYEWLTCNNPEIMLRTLGPKVNNRKLLLFLCASVRQLDDYLDFRAKNIIKSVELFADDLFRREQLVLFQQTTFDTAFIWLDAAVGFTLETALSWPEEPFSGKNEPTFATKTLARKAREYVIQGLLEIENETSGIESICQKKQASILRDLFFLPEEPFCNLLIDQKEVMMLAESFYHNSSFSQMPLLVEPLIESGCKKNFILDHCRFQKEHWRGCWVIDMILKKETL